MAYTTIDNPELYFQTKIYTGNGANNRAITFDGDENMQPDWLWIKNRSEAQSHALFDSVRGATKRYGTNSTGAESTENTNLDSFDTNGFTVDNELIVNGSSDLMVAWAWKAGGSASSNSNGSITSSVSVSTDAGFSIVSYTGTEANATVGHGLGVAPKMIIQKNRIDAQPWWVYHSSIGAGGQLRLSGTDAEGSDGGVLWNSTASTSTVFSLGDNGGSNGSSDACIAYCFAEKKGYSKIGSYTGNGLADNGPFIYTGFKPAWLIVKRTDSADQWIIVDNKRDTDNEMSHILRADANNAEESSPSSYAFDFLSNGFKLKDDDGKINASSGAYVFMAFAEAPFVTSTGIPTTAR